MRGDHRSHRRAHHHRPARKFVAPGNKGNIPIWLTILCGIGGVIKPMVNGWATQLGSARRLPTPGRVDIPEGGSRWPRIRRVRTDDLLITRRTDSV